MVATLILQMHLPPDYVMDRMQLYEAKALMKHAHLAVSDAWEQARLIAYIVAQVNSTKKLEPTDIIKFGWDGGDKKQPTIEEINRLKERAKQFEKLLPNKAEKR